YIDAPPNMEMATAGGAIFGIFFLMIILFSLVSIGLWIWSLIHCAGNKELDENNRLIGLILIICLGLLGSLVYLFLPRKQRNE
ncbi:MAG: PLDc N-terminal domain-containing protein, partial [Bacteroidales bacterium]|nr:PLDc N-terminal domain-containing protein [Bacteroidales bacterium]